MSDRDLEQRNIPVGSPAAEHVIPVIEEQPRVIKRATATEQVRIRVLPEEAEIVVRDRVRREHVEVTRVPMDREVAEAPGVRTEGEVTIIPVLQERLVVEKRLFLVEEIHLRRASDTAEVELPTTVRRTRVEIEREQVQDQEDS